MKTSDSDLKVNRNIYPDAVTFDRMRLIGPKSGHLGPASIHISRRSNFYILRISKVIDITSYPSFLLMSITFDLRKI